MNTRRSYHRASEGERREELIAATLDCIAEAGIEGATVRQIAARAGVTPGLIRHYFMTKDQMLQAAYRQLMNGITQTTTAAAMPASWVMERWSRPMPSSATRAATVPAQAK